MGKAPGRCVIGKERQRQKERTGSLKQADVALVRQSVLPALLRTLPQRHDSPCRCSCTIKSARCA
ncbi:hypothetical protein DGN16_00180 [Xanthomonas citri pv. fuscans]|uniref:Uncharacterized protein n=1 Tax=Xanthomonas citri pv. phaseoli var. fuscans TaxID=473423 RepID=A0A808FEF3_XANCI|nr:hypothetical protein DGN16_00180 [Xanthomonas citri pv. fuscans]QWN06113.1 hypothetical protein DGN11_00180 [Xanthomonas citri pv. fuscans]QWN10250.1 hypothetical protein DGN07_00180 [Xanthomonas citri pv. fuscans]